MLDILDIAGDLSSLGDLGRHEAGSVELHGRHPKDGTVTANYSRGRRHRLRSLVSGYSNRGT